MKVNSVLWHAKMPRSIAVWFFPIIILLLFLSPAALVGDENVGDPKPNSEAVVVSVKITYHYAYAYSNHSYNAHVTASGTAAPSGGTAQMSLRWSDAATDPTEWAGSASVPSGTWTTGNQLFLGTQGSMIGAHSGAGVTYTVSGSSASDSSTTTVIGIPVPLP